MVGLGTEAESLKGLSQIVEQFDSVPIEHGAEQDDGAEPQEEAVYTVKIESTALGTVRPNEIGHIMIIMFHGLDRNSASEPYMCTVAEFKNFLQRLYDEGFRTISLSDLINNNITTPAGYTPVVLTFDDGLATAFSLTTAEDRLVPVPDCAVDIMDRFAEEHPDFGRAATFFINGRIQTFQGEGTLAERMQYLLDNGYEIGNHTYSHARLLGASAAEIQSEMGRLDQLVRAAAPDFQMTAMAYPYGERPVLELRQYVLDGIYDGMEYHYKWALKEGQNGASAAPNRSNFDPLAVPRVRGTATAPTDLGWYFDYYSQHPGARYISDGNPNVIAIPESAVENLNLDSLGAKDLLVYEETSS
jgi:peptidoglycan/xylan/chitin deacetylase (PgdA/CDA1 family)